MLVADLVDVFLATIKLCHSDKVIRVVWISWVDSDSFSRERPLSTEHMYHHHTIGEDVNLWVKGGKKSLMYTPIESSLAGQPPYKTGRVWCHAYMPLVAAVM